MFLCSLRVRDYFFVCSACAALHSCFFCVVHVHLHIASVLRCHCSYLICCFIVIYAKLDERKGGFVGSNIRNAMNVASKCTRQRFWRWVSQLLVVPCKLNCKVHSSGNSSSSGIDFSSLCFCFGIENPALWMYTCTHRMSLVFEFVFCTEAMKRRRSPKEGEIASSLWIQICVQRSVHQTHTVTKVFFSEPPACYRILFAGIQQSIMVLVSLGNTD